MLWSAACLALINGVTLPYREKLQRIVSRCVFDINISCVHF